MFGYHGKKTFSNYQYSHNQLSADNPFRFIGTTFNPYQPKITNQPSQKYDVEIAHNSPKKTLSPYERKSYNNSNNDINDNRPWSKTSSTSSLINNSYNIINNIPYSKNQNYNYSLKPQQRDHVAELFNYTDTENYYYRNNNKNKDLEINNNKNNNINQSSFNTYNDLKSSRTQQRNPYKDNKEDNIKNININEFSSNINNNNNQNKEILFNSQNNQDLNSNNNKTYDYYKNNYDKIINSPFNNYNKYNEKENHNQNIYNKSNDNNYINNYNDDKNNNVEEKLSNIDLSEYSEENCSSVSSYAYKENPNKSYRNYMEDKGRVIQNINRDPNSSLFCLFDGHGGDEVSKFLQSNFYSYFKENLPFDNVKENLIVIFKKIDNKIKDSHFYNIGATACIVYITKENGQKCLYSANIGDTRSLLISLNDYKRLSYDHRATDINEHKRIVESGGIIFGGRVYGTLMLSRCFGDWELKPYGVLNEPYVTRINITDNDKYVVIGTDGVWDVLEDNDVFEMSKNMNNSKEFCNNIVQKAIENGSMDNISCFVIKLN